MADLLRGDYKAHEYGQVILPFTVLQWLDCVLEPTRDKVVAHAKELTGKVNTPEQILLRTAKQPFFNYGDVARRRACFDRRVPSPWREP